MADDRSEPGRYEPMMSPARERQIRRWHVEIDQELRQGLPRRMYYLGLDLLIPNDVFTPMARGAFYPMIRDEVKASDRVLDMGTGCGIGAILAAARSSLAVGVDINPKAVAAARANAQRNGVAGRTVFQESDVFEAVDGAFDLIIFHPPYRWFKPRDWLEASTADENYRALTRFTRQVGRHLRPRGRVLLLFATSGDLEYLYTLIDQAGLEREVMASDEVVTDDLTVTSYVLRLTSRRSR